MKDQNCFSEVYNSLKDVAEFFGGSGFYVLIVIYLRSLLKIVLGKGSHLHRFIPDDNYDHSVSIAKKDKYDLFPQLNLIDMLLSL